MNEQHIKISDIPAVVYGKPSEKVYLYVHGKCGFKQEARGFAEIVCNCGFQVLSFDLPEHGERTGSIKKLVPWDAVFELKQVLAYIKQRWNNASLYAVSLGAFFSLLSFQDELFEKCLFVSPLLDMTALIEKMMDWAQVSAEQLQAKKYIATDFGETLSWEYYTFVKQRPIKNWSSPTAILYAARDKFTERETVTEFCNKFGCRLEIYEEGEHWFHTEKQLAALKNWIVKQTAKINTSRLDMGCAEQQDITDWLGLVNDAASDFPGLDMEDYERTLKESIERKTALYARYDGAMAGVLLFSPAKRELSFLTVHPNYRRHSIASKLIAEMLRFMPDGDISVTTFRADDSRGVAPRALYKKLGFVPQELLTEFGYPVQRFVLYR